MNSISHDMKRKAGGLPPVEVTIMKIFRLVSGTAAALALVTGLAAAQPAAARDRLSPGAAVALGALGGLAVGAAVGAAVAQPQPPVVYRATGLCGGAGAGVLRAPRPRGLCGALLHRALPGMGSRMGLGTSQPPGLPLVSERPASCGPFLSTERETWIPRLR